MTVAYFDASALVKLVVEEAGTALAVELWDGCDAVVSSRLSYPEVRAAVAAATRDRRIAQRALTTIAREWDQYWAGIRIIELNDEISRHAAELCGVHALGGADGVHLASALTLAQAGAEPVMVVWDQRLATGALAVGLRVAPYRRRRRGSRAK